MRSKTALFSQFAAVGKGLANPARLELLDLLAQGECPVELLAAAAGLPLSTASAHLQTLKFAGLVTPRREGTRVLYSLAGQDVAELFAMLRTVAARHRAETEPARQAFLGLSAGAAPGADRGVNMASGFDPAVHEISRSELLARVRHGHVVVIDVRPEREYSAGHIPGAVSIPFGELVERLGELPEAEIVAYCRGEYCVLSYDAVRVLVDHGRRAVRLADGMLEWRLAGLPVSSGTGNGEPDVAAL